MKVFKTFTDSSYSYDGQRTFRVPAFSKLLNVFIEHSNMTILVEYDDLEEETKTIMVRTKEGLNVTEEMAGSFSYKYWGTITQSNSSLINNSNAVVGGVNISMNIFNENKYIHIFYQEIKPLCEMRDEKLNELI
jgi:hypothetical protein